MIYSIVAYGDPVLKKVATDVVGFDSDLKSWFKICTKPCMKLTGWA